MDLYTDIYVPGDYNNTIVTNNGAVNGNNVNNAGAVAWLLDEFAHSDIGNTNGQVALQAAIWHEIYGVGLIRVLLTTTLRSERITPTTSTS